MSAKTKQRAFIVMPFGKKKPTKGPEIDFDRVYAELIKPAVEAADLIAHRADAERRAGSIHADMFQELLLAELVVADLTIDNANVWYELGVRDALRASGSVMLHARRGSLPFDIAGQRMQRYTLDGGAPDAGKLEAERAALTAMLQATMADWRGRRASPVYAQLPNLEEPDWRKPEARRRQRVLAGPRASGRIGSRSPCGSSAPADIMVLADDTPNRVLEFEALRTAADALIKLKPAPLRAGRAAARGRADPGRREVPAARGDRPRPHRPLRRGAREAEPAGGGAGRPAPRSTARRWACSRAPGRTTGRAASTAIRCAARIRWRPRAIPPRPCSRRPRPMPRPSPPPPPTIIRASTR